MTDLDLKQLRMSQGLTQVDVARELKLSAASISRLERGLVEKLDLVRAETLASLLDVDLPTLIQALGNRRT